MNVGKERLSQFSGTFFLAEVQITSSGLITRNAVLLLQLSLIERVAVLTFEPIRKFTVSFTT